MGTKLEVAVAEERMDVKVVSRVDVERAGSCIMFFFLRITGTTYRRSHTHYHTHDANEKLDKQSLKKK